MEKKYYVAPQMKVTCLRFKNAILQSSPYHWSEKINTDGKDEQLSRKKDVLEFEPWDYTFGNDNK